VSISAATENRYFLDLIGDISIAMHDRKDPCILRFAMIMRQNNPVRHGDVMQKSCSFSGGGVLRFRPGRVAAIFDKASQMTIAAH
jgi:hypothetical protein